MPSGWGGGKYVSPAEQQAADDAAAAAQEARANDDQRFIILADAIFDGFKLLANAVLEAAGIDTIVDAEVVEDDDEPDAGPVYPATNPMADDPDAAGLLNDGDVDMPGWDYDRRPPL